MRVGIVGLGDMGKIYARALDSAGLNVSGADVPGRSEALRAELAGTGVQVLESAELLATRSELLIFSVPVRSVGEAVARYGPLIRPGTIVGGQAAVKELEVAELERHLPPSCPIVTCHSLHGPTLSTGGQTLLVVRHRATEAEYRVARGVYEKLGSRIIEVPSASAHDRLMADIQSLTHVCFEAMGTAWSRAGSFPWENPAYSGGIDNVKVLMALRIFAGKAHVYGELAILNAFAGKQIRQYECSVRELLKLIRGQEEARLRERVGLAGKRVLGGRQGMPLLLEDRILGDLSLGQGAGGRTPNSHLSLLAMVDAWDRLGIRPFDQLVAQTPPYRLRLGIVEYLFRNSALLEESLHAATHDASLRRDDELFAESVLDWADVIGRADFDAYERRFLGTRAFFHDQLPQALAQSNELIHRLRS